MVDFDGFSCRWIYQPYGTPIWTCWLLRCPKIPAGEESDEDSGCWTQGPGRPENLRSQRFFTKVYIMGVSKNRATPKWMVKIMENPINWWMICFFFPLFSETSISWQFFVTFLGWLSDPFQWLSDLQLGDEKVTLNHLDKLEKLKLSQETDGWYWFHFMYVNFQLHGSRYVDFCCFNIYMATIYCWWNPDIRQETTRKMVRKKPYL